MKKVEPFFYKDDGTLVINMDSTELDADWLRAARLQEKADRGDVEAARELERMANTPMYEMTGLVDAFNELVEKEKQAYVEGSVKEICNDFACKLSISDREEILSLP